MKLSILVATLSLSVCMMAQSTPSKVVHSSGAYVYMSSPAGNETQVWLYALHTEQGKIPAIFLEFDIFTRNPDGSSTDTFGSGDVPDGALTGNTTKQLNLSVDTSQISSFETTTCRSDGTCERGPFGLVQMQLQADGDYTDQYTSEEHYHFVQVTEHIHFDADSASAVGNGTILDNVVNNGSGQLGTNRSTIITLTPKPPKH